MAYVLIQNGVVVQKQPYMEPGFIVAPDDVVCGYTHSNGSFFQPATPVVLASSVDIERDRRVDAGFTFNGVRYQSTADARENIAGASTAALGAITSASQPGDLRWSDPNKDFAWIAEDNTEVPMDAPTMFTFGQAAMARKSAIIFAARALKNTDPIPADYANDSWWP